MSWLGVGGIAALLLLGGFLFWQYQNSGLDWKSFSIASNDVKKPAIIDSSTNDNDTVPKPAGQQKTNIAQRAATPATTSNATDSAKKAENAVAGNLNKTHHADSTTTVVAATLKEKNDNSLIATDESAGKASNDSQNERSNSLTAAPPKKAEQKNNTTATTKTLSKPAETPDGPESIGSSDYQTGKSLFQKKQYASALLYLRSAAENDNDPHHVEAMYYSALCNLQIGKAGRAKRLFKKVEKTDSPFAAKASEQLKQL